MTKKDALIIALSTLTASTYQNPNWSEGCSASIRKDIPAQEVKETIEKMIDQLSKPREVDEEKKAATNAARKEKTAQARTALVAAVIPALREILSRAENGMTAKELYTEAKDSLPADFSAPKVQNILRREMAPELTVTEAKGKPNVYTLKVAK